MKILLVLMVSSVMFAHTPVGFNPPSPPPPFPPSLEHKINPCFALIKNWKTSGFSVLIINLPLSLVIVNKEETWKIFLKKGKRRVYYEFCFLQADSLFPFFHCFFIVSNGFLLPLPKLHHRQKTDKLITYNI